MNKIDTSNWHPICIGDYFIGNNTGNILARDVEDGSGNTPFVTASGINNGVVGYIDASKYDLIKGHCILVGGKTFTLTYQPDEFVSNDSHNFELHLIDNTKSELVYLFLVAVIKAALGKKYSWADAVTKEKMLADHIMLPCLASGEPDWKYMENTMRTVKKRVQKSLNCLTKFQ